jgi:hypothetical protein
VLRDPALASGLTVPDPDVEVIELQRPSNEIDLEGHGEDYWPPVGAASRVEDDESGSLGSQLSLSKSSPAQLAWWTIRSHSNE